MTQRIFDMEKEQDIKDLFDILPDDTLRVYKDFQYDDAIIYTKSKGGINTMLKIKFGSKKIVSRPVDKSKWIGCLCWFWDNDKEEKYIGILKNIDPERSTPYIKNNGFGWTNCRPVKRNEIKFVEDNE